MQVRCHVSLITFDSSEEAAARHARTFEFHLDSARPARAKIDLSLWNYRACISLARLPKFDGGELATDMITTE